MIKVNVKGKVESILWEGEKSTQILISKANKILVVNIAASKKELMDIIEIGKEFCFIGEIVARLKVRDGRTFAYNTFYIDGIYKINGEELEENINE